MASSDFSDMTCAMALRFLITASSAASVAMFFCRSRYDVSAPGSQPSNNSPVSAGERLAAGNCASHAPRVPRTSPATSSLLSWRA